MCLAYILISPRWWLNVALLLDCLSKIDSAKRHEHLPDHLVLVEAVKVVNGHYERLRGDLIEWHAKLERLIELRIERLAVHFCLEFLLLLGMQEDLHIGIAAAGVILARQIDALVDGDGELHDALSKMHAAEFRCTSLTRPSWKL